MRQARKKRKKEVKRQINKTRPRDGPNDRNIKKKKKELLNITIQWKGRKHT